MSKIFNICIVFLLLFSTSGVAISKHYCGEILQKIAFKGQEKSCCEGEDMPENCCKNETNILKTDNLKLSQHTINLTFTPFLVSFNEEYLLLDVKEPTINLFSENYNSPPPLGQDIIIHVQSFLL
jgi:hypothetical protein